MRGEREAGGRKDWFLLGQGGLGTGGGARLTRSEGGLLDTRTRTVEGPEV